MAIWFILAKVLCKLEDIIRCIMQLLGGVFYECQLDGVDEDFCIMTDILPTCSFKY